MTSRLSRSAPWTVALLALIASIGGIRNGFTYDDRYIVEMNPAMHDLARWWRVFATSYWPRDWGGDGYRPLTILFFKLEYALGHGSPVPFHAVNIALYLVTSVLVYAIARTMLPVWAAWGVAALFAVHPVHVEAVANVVGQSELLVALTILVAVWLYLRDRLRGALRTQTAIAIIVLYLVGCFSKEHAIVLPALLGVIELTVVTDARTIRARFADDRLRTFYVALVGCAIAFIAVRAAILADHGIGGFQPFTPFSSLKITRFQRTLTAIGVVPQWVRLFYWPASLSSEYGPPDIQIAQGLALWQLPGFLLLVGVLALGIALRRREPVISLGIGFACVALLPSSNFLIPAGIVLAERTLFLPSVGALLAVGGVALVLERRARDTRPSPLVRYGAPAFFALALLAGLLRSVDRNHVWHDNETLFNQAVADSPLSYRAHYMLGAWDFERRRKRLGEIEYRKALNLFPYDPAVSYNMAEQYRLVGMCGAAEPLYEWTFDLDPAFPFGRAASGYCYLELGKFDRAKVMAYRAISVGGNVRQARRIIFLADSSRAADTVSSRAYSVTKLAKSDWLAGSPSKVPLAVQKAR